MSAPIPRRHSYGHPPITKGCLASLPDIPLTTALRTPHPHAAPQQLGGEAVNASIAALCVDIHLGVADKADAFYAELRRKWVGAGGSAGGGLCRGRAVQGVGCAWGGWCSNEWEGGKGGEGSGLRGHVDRKMWQFGVWGGCAQGGQASYSWGGAWG